jgi:hypothetical protein
LNKIIFILFIASCNPSFGQSHYPQNDFRNPLEFPMVLAGTFGELRTNHFHSGIDIKTKGKIGQLVHTAMEGYVSRIKISLWGYGKAIYINHPNGYTTVYAHLDKFNDKIENYLKKKQYEKESFEIQLFPNKDELTIEQNEIIALSGNSGGSSAPHLHFEIRDSQTEKTINPLLFGLKVPDDISPTFKGLRMVPFGKEAAINKIPVAQDIQTKKINKHLYVADRVEAIGKIGIQINTYDLLNNTPNKNGVYSIDMSVNGVTVYHHDLETFAFDESKYINLLIDYEHFAKYHNKYQKTYIEQPNRLSIYQTDENKGFIFINDQEDYHVEITIRDIAKNTTTIKIPITGNKVITPIIKENKRTPYFVDQNKYTVFKQGKSEIRFPKHTFFENVYIQYQYLNNKITVHQPKIPLNKNYTLTYFTDSLTTTQKKQIYFARKNKNTYNYINTNKKENKIYTNTKLLGDFYLKYDSISPVIYHPSFYENQNIRKHKTLSIFIKDNESAVKNYYATIDDRWVLMEYEPKKNKLSFDLSDLAVHKKNHVFKLKVQDVLGNTKTFVSKFFK